MALPEKELNKIKIAFIKYDGLKSGGTERWLQNVAVALDKDKFKVDYFYTGEEDTDRLKFMIDNNISLIKISANGKISPYGKWIDTDLFDKFNEKEYDIVQNAIAGASEWPFNILKTPLVESIHLDYDVNFDKNVYYSFFLSEWMRNKWSSMGGIKKLSDISVVGIKMPYSTKNLRDELGIPENAIVAGFHQRVDDNIFSEIPIYAYKNNEASNHYFLIMGGSKKYKELADKLQIKNFMQLEHSGDSERISKFLNTLDIFAHGRRDGETFGYVIIEALLHHTPCIVHKATSNAQKNTIGPGGFFVKKQNEYNQKLKLLFENKSLREKLSSQGFSYAKKTYIDTDYIKIIENKYTDIVIHPVKNRLLINYYHTLRTLKNWIFTLYSTGTHLIIKILGLKIKIKI